MTKTLGFIGAGNIATAIIGGVIKAGLVSGEKILVSDSVAIMREQMTEKFGTKIVPCNIELAQEADIIFLCVKPQVYEAVIKEIRAHVKKDAVVIILAAGLGLAAVAEMFSRQEIKLVKTMPNTPALVNCGMTALCAAPNVSGDDMAEVLAVFNSVGKTEILPEKQFDIFTALAGSSPAYVCMFVEAMADAGVKHGFSRKQAIDISVQALLGTAKMLAQTGEHPAVLREAVCSPSGTTIEAVCELERLGLRNAVISAVSRCTEKYNK
ncbi:MAG: pyrroline-5-carboxylate reductase [Defluviitaleaceae bacterium]|nr:pyrroline-5-carboxylate reductase [Defluviitaleaceae bacterium]